MHRPDSAPEQDRASIKRYRRFTTVVTAAITSAAFSIRKWLWQVHEGMPEELRTARLLFSEQPLWAHKPIPLYGVPDQVYLTRDNELVLVDTKNRSRPRVTLKDVVQLSVYLVILRYARHPAIVGRAARPYAYVRCETHGKVQYLAVRLLTTEQILHFVRIYLRSKSRDAGVISQAPSVSARGARYQA